MYFQDVPAVVVSASPTQLIVEAPEGVVTGPFSVAGAGGRGHSLAAFRVLALAPAEVITVYPKPASAAFTISWRPATFDIQQVRAVNALGGIVFGQGLQTATTNRMRGAQISDRPGEPRESERA
jgi:hypothetical protein